MHMLVYIFIHMYIDMYIHMYIYTYKSIYMYKCIYMNLSVDQEEEFREELLKAKRAARSEIKVSEW